MSFTHTISPVETEESTSGFSGHHGTTSPTSLAWKFNGLQWSTRVSLAHASGMVEPLRAWLPGPLPQAPDQSVPCRTSTTSSRSKCSPPDLNHKKTTKIYQIEFQKECQKICQNRMPERMSEHMPERMTSRWYARNYVRIMDQGGDHSKKVISAPTIRIIQWHLPKALGIFICFA